MCNCEVKKVEQPAKQRYPLGLGPYGRHWITPESGNLVIVESDGHIHFAKRRLKLYGYFERVHGRWAGRVLGRRLYDITLPPKLEKKLLQLIRRAIGAWSREHIDAFLNAAYQGRPWRR